MKGRFVVLKKTDLPSDLTIPSRIFDLFAVSIKNRRFLRWFLLFLN